MAVDDEQDRVTLVHGDEDDEGVGADKAARAARGEAPDGKAPRRDDDNQGEPTVIECVRMAAGRGTLPEPHHAPLVMRACLKGAGELPATPLMSLGEAGRRVWEERGMSG